MLTLKEVKDQNPWLSQTGIEDWFPMPPQADYSNRIPLDAGDGNEQFARAISWLLSMPARKTVNPKASSYSMKHIAEKVTGGYISNGCLIAAAMAIGFPVKHIFGTSQARIGVGLLKR